MPTPMPGPVCAYCGRTTIWGGCPCHGAHLAAKDRVIQEQAATIVALRKALGSLLVWFGQTHPEGFVAFLIEEKTPGFSHDELGLMVGKLESAISAGWTLLSAQALEASGEKP